MQIPQAFSCPEAKLSREGSMSDNMLKSGDWLADARPDGELPHVNTRPSCALMDPRFVSDSNEAPGADGATNSAPSRLLIRRFRAFASLSTAEVGLLDGLVETMRYHPPMRDLRGAGANRLASNLIVSGWGCRYRQLSGGRRQIISLRLPGDFLETLPGCPLPSPFAIAALTELETVDGQALVTNARAAEQRHSGLAHGMALMDCLDNLLLCEQVVRVGRQSAFERFAHLMLRLHERLDQVGLAERDRFAMPLTQDVLADVLGLSAVHINRTVQQMRRDDLLEMKNGMVILLNPDKLRQLADWVKLPELSAPRFEESQRG